MRICVQKDNLVKGVQTVQSAVSTRASLPILSNILIEAQKEGLLLTATDLDVAISCFVPAESVESGSITVPAKRFADVIKELPSENEVRLFTDKSSTVRIESGKTYFKIPGLPKDDYPQIPQFESGKNSASIPQLVLAQMIKMTSFAMSRDEARYVLNGTLFVFQNNTLRLVATDGRRLAMIEREIQNKIEGLKKIIIPTKTIQELSKNLGEGGEVTVNFKENQVQFKIGNTAITTRLIDGEYPNYEQVIPKKTKEQLVIDTKDFLSATKRASIFTNAESQSIKINLSKNRMMITKNTPEIGEAYEEIPAEYEGGDFIIGFNPSYLIDVLKNIHQDKIKFELIDPEKPGMIRTEDQYTYIILPMQLTS